MIKFYTIFKRLSLLSLLLVGLVALPGQGAWAAPAADDDHGCCQRDQQGDDRSSSRDCSDDGSCHACGCCARVVVNHQGAARLVYERATFAVGAVLGWQKPAGGHFDGIFHPPKA